MEQLEKLKASFGAKPHSSLTEEAHDPDEETACGQAGWKSGGFLGLGVHWIPAGILGIAFCGDLS